MTSLIKRVLDSFARSVLHTTVRSTQKPSPGWLISFSLLVFGAALVYTILRQPQTAVWAVALGTLVLVMSVFLLTMVSLDGNVRIAPMVHERYYPYESLASKLEWQILSGDGGKAVLRKWRTLRFLENDVDTIREYVWGDEYERGRPPKPENFQVSPGRIIDIYREGGKHVLLVAFPRPYQVDERLDFYFERHLKDAFARPSEWIEFQPYANSRREELSVVLPAGRKVRSANARFRHGDYSKVYQDGENEFRIVRGQDRQGDQLSWILQEPIPRASYFIEWEW